MHKVVRQILTKVRRELGLPTDDVDFLYDVLVLCPLGVPLNRLCVMLGLYPSDFQTAWDLLHKLEKRHASDPNFKLKHWGGKRGPGWVTIEKFHPIGNYYQKIAPLMREATEERMITRPERPPQQERERKVKKYLKFYKQLPEVFTRTDIQQVTGYTSHAVISVVERWLDLKMAIVRTVGKKGYNNPYTYLKVVK